MYMRAFTPTQGSRVPPSVSIIIGGSLYDKLKDINLPLRQKKDLIMRGFSLMSEVNATRLSW